MEFNFLMLKRSYTNRKLIMNILIDRNITAAGLAQKLVISDRDFDVLCFLFFY